MWKLSKKTFETFCDSSTIQEFSIRPGGFLGYFKINVVLYISGLASLRLKQTELAVVLATAAVLTMVFDFFMYKEYVDFLFPKKYRQNTIGSIDPTGDVKQQIIISGYHDCGHIFNFLANDSATYSSKVMRSVAALLGVFLFCWISFVLELFRFQGDIIHWVLT